MARLGDMLVYLRKREGLSQKDLADILKVSRSAIGMYETGKREPDIETLEAIADYYNVDMNTVTGQRKPPPAIPADAIPYVRGRQLPILGSIPAGVPVLAAENIEGYDYADVPEGEGYFFLRVKGDSMLNAGVNSGDLVLIKQQNYADSGNIVACIVNGDEATLKRFHQKGDIVILQPENSAHAPVIVPCKDFETGRAKIIGVVTELKRKLL